MKQFDDKETREDLFILLMNCIFKSQVFTVLRAQDGELSQEEEPALQKRRAHHARFFFSRDQQAHSGPEEVPAGFLSPLSH